MVARHRRMNSDGTNLKTKLSAHAAGAYRCWRISSRSHGSVPGMRKRAIAFTSYRDGAGIWTIWSWSDPADGRPSNAGDEVNLSQMRSGECHRGAIKALAWVDQNVRVHLTPHSKGRNCRVSAPINIGPGEVLSFHFYRKLNAGDRRRRLR